MHNSRFCQLALVALLAFPLPCGAATITTIEGTLADADQLGIGTFTLSGPTWVWIQTWSHGGGMASNGTTVAGGNFDPVIWLFSGDAIAAPASTAFITDQDDGLCPPGNPGLFGCVDSTIGYTPGGQPPLVLGPGTYSVVVSVFSKYFLGSVGDPFDAGSFNTIGPNFYEDTGAGYFVDVQDIPEPGGMTLLGLGLVGTALLTRRRR